MRIFVTGASGFIGSATVTELLNNGHEVLGLARSDESAAIVDALGADVLRGSINDLDSLREGAKSSDGVIHLAYKHDFSDMAAAAGDDLAAIEAMCDELVDTDKPFIGTSGTLSLAMLRTPGEAATLGLESDSPEPAVHRLHNENVALSYASRGVRSSIVRLSPTVHGEGDHGFVPRIIDFARANAVSPYVGDGANRWPAVHRLDAARLFRLAAESAPAGIRLHGVADEGVAFRDIATVIGQHLNIPVVGIPASEAAAHFAFLGNFVQLDNPTSSVHTQALLHWKPEHAALLADLDAGHYFKQ
jgi:nucleoside-diphosphate-sugar epimerase